MPKDIRATYVTIETVRSPEAEELISLANRFPEVAKRLFSRIKPDGFLFWAEQTSAPSTCVTVLLKVSDAGMQMLLALRAHEIQSRIRVDDLGHACLAETGPLGVAVAAFMAFCKRRESVRRSD